MLILFQQANCSGRTFLSNETSASCRLGSGTVGFRCLPEPDSLLRVPHVSCCQSSPLLGPPNYSRSSLHTSALFRPCLRPSERVPARSVPSKLRMYPGQNRPRRRWRLQRRMETVLTGRVAGTRSDGRKQGRISADGCGEDRASLRLRLQTDGAAAAMMPGRGPV